MNQELYQSLQEKIFDLRHAQQTDYSPEKRQACEKAIKEIYSVMDKIEKGDQNAVSLGRNILASF